ncbi:MAG: glycosyltransferase family 2 protein, partial [Paracoccaceae bacterium]|nr:glycosyltransferase family 2 protein [Paracoccaceae bacterium]
PFSRYLGQPQALIERLSKLTYPKPLLEILLVVEENDHATRAAVRDTHLPAWMKPIYVPEGHPKTKPRALNHAYKFCSGDIIGIYDAEDMPARDQIERVIEKFKSSGPDVACVQGILQFYNPRQNWLARCFTMDYAGWFRIILPGLAKLGLPVPLGGTTLFLKRDVIDLMHGWDAYNVTEDADLGLRIGRAGYRTLLVDSITGEEANCHGWRWIRQRSRWIKGYMVTYWSHMRTPLQLRRDLGNCGFLAFQVLFLGTILHFMTAPILWSFWLVYFGVDHSFFNAVPDSLVAVTAYAFLAVEILGMVILGLACIRADRRFLIPWLPTMSIYFLLAVPAGIKALWEFCRAPVFWDKTDHGHSLKSD